MITRLPNFGKSHFGKMLGDNIPDGRWKNLTGIKRNFICWVDPKIGLLIVSFFLVGISYGQSTTVRYVRTEPNGVQVYESIGNEGVLGHDYSVPVPPPSIRREVEDFTLAECQDALYHINSKIETVQATQDGPERKKKLDDYEKAKTRVLDRIEALTSTPH